MDDWKARDKARGQSTGKCAYLGFAPSALGTQDVLQMHMYQQEHAVIVAHRIIASRLILIGSPDDVQAKN